MDAPQLCSLSRVLLCQQLVFQCLNGVVLLQDDAIGGLDLSQQLLQVGALCLSGSADALTEHFGMQGHAVSELKLNTKK